MSIFIRTLIIIVTSLCKPLNNNLTWTGLAVEPSSRGRWSQAVWPFHPADDRASLVTFFFSVPASVLCFILSQETLCSDASYSAPMPFAVCLLREFAWPSSRRPSQHSALPTCVRPDAQKHSSSLCLHQQLKSVFSLTITHTFSPERQCYVFHSWHLVMLFQPYRACTTIHYVNCTSVILHTHTHTRTSLKLYQCKPGINMNI